MTGFAGSLETEEGRFVSVKARVPGGWTRAVREYLSLEFPHESPHWVLTGRVEAHAPRWPVEAPLVGPPAQSLRLR